MGDPSGTVRIDVFRIIVEGPVDIGAWLREVGLERYENAFRENVFRQDRQRNRGTRARPFRIGYQPARSKR